MGPVRIILASQSPGGGSCWSGMGILNFEIIPARGREVLDPAPPAGAAGGGALPPEGGGRWLPVRRRRTW